jgi:glycosyltransferase involved in cell wall biosynthesis
VTTLLVLSDSLAPTDGVGQLAAGTLRAFGELAPELRCDVRLARDAELPPLPVDPRIAVRADLPRAAWTGERGWIARWLGARAAAQLAPFAFERPRAILCWKEHPFTGIAARWAAKLGVPWVSFAHGTYALRALADARTRGAALAEHRSMRACFAVSALVERRLRALAELPQLELLPNGIDLALYRDRDPRSAAPPCGTAPFALTLAPAKERKGLHLALSTWRGFAAAHPEWHWVLVGAEHRGEPYGRELAEALARVPRVHRVARIDEATKQAWLRRARVHLFTPVEARDGALEGFGLPCLEAGACGTPTIATTSCGAAEHVGRAIGTFVAPEERALRVEMERLAARGAAERARGACDAVRAVRAHDLRRGAARVLEVLELLPQGAARR